MRVSPSFLALFVTALFLGPSAVGFAPATPPPSCFQTVSDPGLDVLFVMDLTGSMGGVLTNVKNEASGIMTDLAAARPDIRFAAASHMDYPGTYAYPGYSATYGSAGDYPWRLDQDMTPTMSLVQNAIDGMVLGNGGDGPESYVTAMHESAQSVSWGAARNRIIIFFADNVPHDLNWNGQNTGGEPGPDFIAMTSDDLDWETTVANLAANQIRVVGINSGGAQSMMSYLAAETNGAWTTLAGGPSFRQTIVSMTLGVANGPTAFDVIPPTVSVTAPTSARLIINGVDSGPSPFAETALIGSNLPITLAAGDNCKLKRVEIRENGAVIASFTDFPLAYTYLAANLPPGYHALEIRAFDWVNLQATAYLNFRVLVLDERATAMGVYAATNVPVSVEVGAGVARARGIADSAESIYAARAVSTSQGDVSFEVLRANADTDRSPQGVASAVAVSHISGLSVLNGLIRADTVRASSAVWYDVAGNAVYDTSGSYIERLVIDGNAIEFTGAAQEVQIPRMGYVRLFEIESDAGPRAVQQVNMIHVFLDTPSLKGEIIIGSAFAAAGALDARDVHHRAIHDIDDAGTDADASHSGPGTTITPGVYSGRVGRGDVQDTYGFEVQEGERIGLAFAPALRVQADVIGQPTVAPVSPGVATATDIALESELRLYDPNGILRDRTMLAQGDRIEMNADTTGRWIVVIDGDEEATQRNYTLALTLTPIVFYDGDDLDGDAPASCTDARFIEHGPHIGVMRGADRQDAYRFQVKRGEAITVALKPDELDDGANFDLLLYDPDCRLLDSSALGHRTDIIPKGTPDAIVRLAAHRTGEFRAIVVRENGIGNYYLHVSSLNPMPTLANNDAGTGGDSTGPGDAIAIAAPRVVQGSFPDEFDTEDWYRVSSAMTDSMRITFEGSATSLYAIWIYDMSLNIVATGNAGAAPAQFAVGGGPYYVRIIPQLGGGNYMLGAISTP